MSKLDIDKRVSNKSSSKQKVVINCLGKKVKHTKKPNGQKTQQKKDKNGK